MSPMPLMTLAARERSPAADSKEFTTLPTATAKFFEFAADTTSSTSTTSSSATSATATQSQSSGGLGSGEGSFYKNLFYILIGLLCAFGIVSFTSLMRSRKRRRNILREAARLGVIVPGQEGYISIRDRSAMTWVRSDGSDDPGWWEINEKKAFSEETGGSTKQANQAAMVPTPTPLQGLEEFGSQPDDFCPLSIIPPRVEPVRGPSFEPSPLPYFPNHLAYRPDDVIPPLPRFTADNPESLTELAGESVDVITIIRMPGEEWSSHRANESEEVMREWGGVELGMLKLDVEEAR